MIETAIRGYALASTVVVGFMGQRLYQDVLPQTPVLPAATYQRIDQQQGHLLDEVDGLKAALVQIDVYAKDRRAVREAAAAIASRLNGARFVRDDYSVQGVFLVATRDDSEQDTSQARIPLSLFRVSMDFRVRFKQAS